MFADVGPDLLGILVVVAAVQDGHADGALGTVDRPSLQLVGFQKVVLFANLGTHHLERVEVLQVLQILPTLEDCHFLLQRRARNGVDVGCLQTDCLQHAVGQDQHGVAPHRSEGLADLVVELFR